ncbi:unnamed protein product [Ambrosiozyma monospora]|uniref:Unnamed protein product n=1 Tax=Ambrosiozyma monospora TaxID=43982 RepID=A0ACB5SWK7_AMBMO|nr:unnamed protein product [Ambrosiozyma monospora]
MTTAGTKKAPKKVQFSTLDKVETESKSTENTIKTQKSEKSQKKSTKGTDKKNEKNEHDSTTEESDESNEPVDLSPPSSSILLIPYHYILLIFSILQNYEQSETVNQAIFNSLISLIVMQSMYGIIVSEFSKRSGYKSTGPTAFDFLFVSVWIVLSLALSLPISMLLATFTKDGHERFGTIGESFSKFSAGEITKLEEIVTFHQLYLCGHVAVVCLFPSFVYHQRQLIKGNLKSLLGVKGGQCQVYFALIGGLAGCVISLFSPQLEMLPSSDELGLDFKELGIDLVGVGDDGWTLSLLVGTYIGSFVGGVGGYVYSKFSNRR